MKVNSYRLIQFLLWCGCAYHLGVGFGLNISAPGFLQLMAAYHYVNHQQSLEYSPAGR
jgi:hypothetical protein